MSSRIILIIFSKCYLKTKNSKERLDYATGRAMYHSWSFVQIYTYQLKFNISFLTFFLFWLKKKTHNDLPSEFIKKIYLFIYFKKRKLFLNSTFFTTSVIFSKCSPKTKISENGLRFCNWKTMCYSLLFCTNSLISFEICQILKKYILRKMVFHLGRGQQT